MGISLTAPAFAATVSTVQGQVLVNKGPGYQQVPGATQADAGATVMANPGGAAQITYPDGCTVNVQPGSVYTIAPQSPCQTGATGPNGGTLLLGGVVIAGGIAAALLLKNKSASP